MRMQQFREAQKRQLHELQHQIPDDIARMAHEQHLGSPQLSHSVVRLNRGWRWVLPIFFLSLLFDALVVFIVIIIGMNYPAGTPLLLPIMLSFAGIFYLELIIGLIVASLKIKICSVYTCDGGFVLKQSATKFRVVRWDEIDTIWQASARHPLTFYMRNGNLYTIRCHDGYTLTISELSKYTETLNKTFEQQFTRRRLPFHFADYQAGQMLNFGPLSMNREGVSVQGQMLAWEQVADISLIKGRHLVIYKVGERPEVWLKLPAFKIPNLSILLALFKRIRGQGEQEMSMEKSEAYGTGATVVAARRRIDPLPEGFAALAEEHLLGERPLDQRLGRSRLIGWATIITLLVIEAIMAASIVISGIATFLIFTSNSHNFSPAILYEFAFYSLLFIPFITISIIHGFQQIHNYTYTFENGFILKRGQRAPIICRWEDIESVERLPVFISTSTSQQQAQAHTIHTYNGDKYMLTRLNIDQQALGKIIQEQVVPLQLPATVAAYQEQQTLSFGLVQANLQGIIIDAQLLPWDQVKSVSLQNNHLVVYDITRRKPWGRVPAKQVPNLFLLFALADYARGNAGSFAGH